MKVGIIRARQGCSGQRESSSYVWTMLIFGFLTVAPNKWYLPRRQSSQLNLKMLEFKLRILPLPTPACARLGPSIFPTPLLEPFVIPIDILHRLLHPNLQNALRLPLDAFIQEAKILIQQQIRTLHHPVSLWHKTHVVLVPVTEELELLVRDLEVPSIAERLVATVFFIDDEHLEALPAFGAEGLDGGVHVFLPVVPVDDGVDFEHDSILLTEHCEVFEFLQMLGRAATDLDVGGFVKGVAGDRHDVDVFAVFGEPGGGDFAAVRDDRNGFELECGFAVSCQLAKESGVHEGLAAGEVDFAHAGFFEEEHGALGVV